MAATVVAPTISISIILTKTDFIDPTYRIAYKMAPQTISELIKKLEEVMKQHGDLPVMHDGLYDTYTQVHGVTVTKVVDEWDTNKAVKVVVIGQ